MNLLRKILSGLVLTAALCACNGDVFTTEDEYNNSGLEIYPKEVTLPGYVGAEQVVMFSRGDWCVAGLFNSQENSLGTWTDADGNVVSSMTLGDRPFTCNYQTSFGLAFSIIRVNPDDIRIQVTGVPAGEYSYTYWFRVYVGDVWDMLYINFKSGSQKN